MTKFFFTVEAAVEDPSKPPMGGVVESVETRKEIGRSALLT